MKRGHTPSLFDFQSLEIENIHETLITKEPHLEYKEEADRCKVYDTSGEKKIHMASIDLQSGEIEYTANTTEQLKKRIAKQAKILHEKNKAFILLRKDGFNNKNAKVIYPYLSQQEKVEHEKSIHQFLIEQISEMKKEIGGNILNENVLADVHDISITYTDERKEHIIGFSLLDTPYQCQSVVDYLSELENRDGENYANFKAQIKKSLPVLEDAGEKIEGARKFEYTELNTETVESMTIEEKYTHIKKKHIFPPINKKEMKEEGYNPQLVAYVIALRNAMPANITSNMTRNYKNIMGDMETQKASRNACVKRLETEISQLKVSEKDKDGTRVARKERWRAKEINNLEELESAKEFTHNNSIPLDEAEMYYRLMQLTKKALEHIPKSFSYEQAAMTIRRFLNEEGILLYEENNRTASLTWKGRAGQSLGFFKNKFFNLVYNIDNTTISNQFNNQNWETLLSVNKREGIQRKESMASKLSRLEYLDEHIRVGEDRRIGKDVAPQDFIDVFGFRGIQFGNYLNNTERQQVMNKAYDAIKDLMEVMGLPDRAMGLNNTLAIAFGARGRGGKASAHYEPKEKVINLTKYSGAGSLAHEWAHALDHHLYQESGIEYDTKETKQFFNVLSETRGATTHIYHGSVFKESYFDSDTKQYEQYMYSEKQKNAQATMGIISIFVSKASTKEKYSLHMDSLIEDIDKKGINALTRITGNSMLANPIPKYMELCSKLDSSIYYNKSIASQKKGWRRKYYLDKAENILEKDASSFMQSSVKLDGDKWTGKSAYFSTRVERFARAMEVIVADALHKKGCKNDFLVGAIKLTNIYEQNGLPNPYPSKEERSSLKPIFEALKEGLAKSEILTTGFGKKIKRRELLEPSKDKKRTRNNPFKASEI